MVVRYGLKVKWVKGACLNLHCRTNEIREFTFNMKSKQEKYPKDLKKQNALLEAIRQMQNNYFKPGMNYGWCEETLKSLLLLTDSKFGFICELQHKKDGTPYLKSHIITNIAWNDETRKFYKENKEKGLEFFNFNSIWGQVINTGKPYISDDPDADPNKGGYPKESGHPHLKKFLGMPIKGSDNRVIGIMAVANNPNGYTNEFVSFLEPFVSTYGILMEQERLKRKEKKAEQEILYSKEKAEESEEKLKQSDRVFNLTLDMFCIAGFDGYFKYLNPAWERTLGWSIEELLSKPWLDFVHPDDAENTENIKSVLVYGKEIYQFENRYISKDGSIKWLSWNSQPFPKENIMIGAVRDITETKRIENELLQAKEKVEESEAKYRKLFSNASDAIFSYNPDNFEIIEANKATSDLYGYSHDELIGMSFLLFIAEVEKTKAVGKSIKTNQVVRVKEQHHKKKDGTKLIVELNTSNLIVNGRNIYYCICHDITDIKEKELKLKESESALKERIKEQNGIYESISFS
jgi:PAS domain S-box-containing protein